MKKILSFIIFSIWGCMLFSYQDMLYLLELKTLFETKENIEIQKNIEAQKNIENLADLKLWYLETTQPKIFVRIETADNATPMGYFRKKYHAAGKIGKLNLIHKKFKIK